MNAIAPGTPCFLVGLEEMVELLGRVVTVESGPMPAPEGESAEPVYKVAAAWAREMFQGRDMVAPRAHLLPIVPPTIAPAARTRTPEKVKQ